MPRQANEVGIKEIVIVNAGGELSVQIQQGLREKRYATRIVNGIDHLKGALSTFNEPIIVFEAGPSPITLEQCVTQLFKISAEVRLPIILIGDGADSYERELDRAFPAATTLNIPYGTAEILAAITYLSRTYVERRKNAAKAKAEPAAAAEEPIESPHELYAKSASIPSLVFAQLDKLDLFGKNLGGAIFSSTDLTEDYLVSQRMMPSDAELQKLMREVCVEAGNWGRQHLTRTSFMSQKIVDAMSPDQELRENVKVAGILYAAAFASKQPLLLRRSYFDGTNGSIRPELSARIQESAGIAKKQLNLEQVGAIIATLARLISREEQVGDDDVMITASAIMAADAAGRICYGTGVWNPRRAYILMSRLKNGDIRDFHPAVLCCTVKFLAEALAARTPLFLLKKELRNNKQFLQALQAEARKPVGKGERRVPLSALVPGMKLSKPLKSLDGREILSTNLVLDEDLIWRIWQLSAIRPLTSPIVRSTP